MTRTGVVERATGETTVRVRLELDGNGQRRIATGIGFFDHLLDQLARHGLLDLEIETTGDLVVDEHHTVEDTGIAIGRALDEALGDRAGIRRFGEARIPLDEALADCVIDLGGRSSARIEPRPDPLTGISPWLELLPHFLESVAREARLTLHLEVRGAASVHHHAEAAMKAFARALRSAAEPDPRLARDAVPSTKGTLR
jgi:imidazoleglycerol-phosphate dehydratase